MPLQSHENGIYIAIIGK